MGLLIKNLKLKNIILKLALKFIKLFKVVKTVKNYAYYFYFFNKYIKLYNLILIVYQVIVKETSQAFRIILSFYQHIL